PVWITPAQMNMNTGLRLLGRAPGGRNPAERAAKEGVPDHRAPPLAVPRRLLGASWMTASPPHPALCTAARRRDVVRADVLASLVVSLVAVARSLGIALAAGGPLMAGRIAAVGGGEVAGPLGGSPMLVSGPAAGMTVVVAELVARFGWQTTCLVTAGAVLL